MEYVLKRIFLWDFPRASWQYDVIVIAILAFIFLTPRDFFGDLPRTSNISRVELNAPGIETFYLKPVVLAEVPEADRFAAAGRVLEKWDSRRRELSHLTPIVDSENQIIGYMAQTRVIR